MSSTLLLVLRVLSQVLVIIGIPVLFYGSFRFASGPIVAAHGGFYTHGIPRSYEDFRAFQLWQTTMFTLWPAMLAIVGLRYWLDPRGLKWIWRRNEDRLVRKNDLTRRSS